MSDVGELYDGFSAQQIFRDEASNGFTFDDIIALVRASLCTVLRVCSGVVSSASLWSTSAMLLLKMDIH